VRGVNDQWLRARAYDRKVLGCGSWAGTDATMDDADLSDQDH
jgi:hypothetical protein